jgi:ankyrin repeat protein
VDVKGDGIISYAASSGSIEVLRAALDRDIETFKSTEWGLFYWACRTGKLEIIKLLIDEGSHSCELVTIPEFEGQWNPFAIIIYHGNKDMLESLPVSSRSILGAEPDTEQRWGEQHGGYGCDGFLNVSIRLKSSVFKQ